MERPERLERLRHIIRDMGEAAVAYSGGADSTLVLRIARDELGEKAAAIICSTGLMAQREVEEAVAAARGLGAEVRVVEADLLARPDIARNPPDRCYLCKRAIIESIGEAASGMGLRIIADGTHCGDEDGDRPGMRALREHGVRSPLAEAGMDKADVREVSRALGLSTMSRPSSPCLATRIPFGEAITRERLRQVDEAERLLRQLGYGQVRVRHHGPIARVEVEERFLSRALEDREIIISGLRELGFTYVVLDLAGFRSGSMSEPVAGPVARP
jgi:uncharacterized protein